MDNWERGCDNPPPEVARARTIPYSSQDPGGFVEACCDENTRFLSKELHYVVYALLVTSHGLGAKLPGTTTNTLPVDQRPPANEADLQL